MEEKRKKEKTVENDIISLLAHFGFFLNQYKMTANGQGKILKSMAEVETITQKELLARSNVSPAALSETLSKLEQKGFIIRNRDEQDKRIAVIHITEAGKREAMHYSTGDIQGVFSGMTEEERQQLAVLLRKLMNSWKAERGLTDAGHRKQVAGNCQK